MVDIKKMQACSIISVSPRSPTFTYSSDKVSEIAARVVEEFRQEPSYQQEFTEEKDHDDNDDDFEFAFVCNKDPDMSPVAADEIFYKGQIKPTYPLFNNDIDRIPKPRTHRLPLGKLMMSEERETTSFCSSEEADELDRVKPGTYCVWTPKASNNNNKSNSSGRSSKRWKLRDLLYATSNTDQTCNKDMEIPEKFKEEAYEEEHSNRDMKPGDMMMRRSFFPNTHDLVGIFSNINGFSRNLHPF